MLELLLLFLLFTKHFIVDFPLQVPYHYENKGTYGHAGGIQHALFHGLGTTLVFIVVFSLTFVPFAVMVGLIDAFIHYHIDWAKVKLNKKYGWGPATHEQFWWLLGLDQYLHALTYIGLVLFVAY